LETSGQYEEDENYKREEADEEEGKRERREGK
jgi:hypothetical protein